MSKQKKRSFSTGDRFDDELFAVNTFIQGMVEKYNYTYGEVFELLSKAKKKEELIRIPTCIFRNRQLGIMECIVKYLKENSALSYHQIAAILCRDDRVIWVIYNKAQNKEDKGFKVQGPNHWLDISIFKDRSLGPLQTLVVYLKDKARMSYNEIAKLLDRDNRTIWAVYNRKREVKKVGV